MAGAPTRAGYCAMNAAFTPLQHLHTAERTPNAIVAHYDNNDISWQQLLLHVAALREQIETRQGETWALFHEESYPFAVALLCLLGLGKTVYLPANNTSGTTASLRDVCQHFIGEWPQGIATEIAQPILAAPSISASSQRDAKPLAALTGQLVLFTSGSTGTPKAIAKNLSQIDAELQTHEQLWGALWRNAQVLATVSHQHIYGLLFKVLGPLCSGRCFHSAIFRDPANLLKETAARASIWIASPAHLQRLQNEWLWNADSLVATFCSGGELARNAAQHCRELSGHWPLEIYGSSETGGIATRTQEHDNTAWLPLPGVSVNVEETLHVRSPHLPDDTWFATADRAEIIGEKFNLGARADRIVKIEGKRVALPEIELQLNNHPWIAQARATIVNRGRQRIGVVAELSAIGAQQLIKLGSNTLSRQLRIYLQEYFEPIVLPRLWRFATIPVDSQGKTNAAALTALFDDTQQQPIVTMPIVKRSEIAAPRCALDLQIPNDLIYLRGHFPGAAVVPGVALLRWVEYFARAHLAVTGSCRQLEVIKFKQLVRPGDELTLTLDYQTDTGKLKFAYSSAHGEHSSGRLCFEADHV